MNGSLPTSGMNEKNGQVRIGPARICRFRQNFNCVAITVHAMSPAERTD